MFEMKAGEEILILKLSQRNQKGKSGPFGTKQRYVKHMPPFTARQTGNTTCHIPALVFFCLEGLHFIQSVDNDYIGGHPHRRLAECGHVNF
jgi:hypothetical protein